MSDKVSIELENMKFYAYHGHYEVEQKVGNHFLVTLICETSSFDALKSDRLKDALDYQQLYRIVKREMEIPSHLLEHVAERMATSLFAEVQGITRIRIKISKMNPPMGGEIEKVSITLERNI
ncbi:MAG TPA: dihydroneopterin aldolase [Prolixibacteraceae bacterium]|nr:dihydroneopterin aldolase [Prolixibacteraceae bacterium]HOR99689.1 dihydroneopterin aldolase [Prolixibacteraceae bacterium]HOS89105.1 dihydroneopterin aldolase [Prolixibacteraceae bacterium]HPL44267.1 dihydroneopterin aldolase [Prolixibacteraceae bacterium]HPV19313.1 dihydroneopterin aldolase [Prolixibacteraceae bacterium]